MAWRRLPPFSFSALVSSWVLIVAGAVMLAALVMLEIDRHFSGVFFDAGEGGAPLYYQHLSWIFFTGCYLLFLLPAAGAISEILPTFSGKPLLSRGAVSGSIAAIGALGLLAWMQNMYSAAIPIGWLYGAMAMALLLAIPLGVLFVNWIGTLALGSIHLRAPMLFALGAISTLSFGLAGELMHAVIPVNWLLGNTVDATAVHRATSSSAGRCWAGFAALYYWFPKMTGRTMGEAMARASLLLIIVGAHLTLIPMVLAGLEGQPVDVYKYFDTGSLDIYNLLSTIGAFVLVGGITVSLLNAYLSVRGGARAGHDPWRGDSLEWLALSPPPPHNFDVVPDVRSEEPLRDIREAVEQHEAPRARARGRAVGEHRAGSLSRMNGPGGTRAGEGGDELRRFRRLADLTAITTFLLIIVGGVVRVSESGLGCGPGGSGTEGWPLCGGEVIPLVGDVNRIIEFSHRVLAAIVVALIALLAWRAYKGLRRQPLAAARLGRGRRPGPGAGGPRRPHGRAQPRRGARRRPPRPRDGAARPPPLARRPSPRRARRPPRTSRARPPRSAACEPYAAVAAILLLGGDRRRRLHGRHRGGGGRTRPGRTSPAPTSPAARPSRPASTTASSPSGRAGSPTSTSPTGRSSTRRPRRSCCCSGSPTGAASRSRLLAARRAAPARPAAARGAQRLARRARGARRRPPDHGDAALGHACS